MSFTRESSIHRTNLIIHASYPDGGMNTRRSGRHHIQKGESGNVQEDPGVVRCCDGGDSNHEQMHTLSVGETQDPSTSPVTLEEDLQVPDGGWGWLVALGTFIIMMLYQSVGPIFGILFSGYLLEKGTSSATTAWVFNIQIFVKNIIAPLIRPLAKEFGWRRIGYIGVFMSSFSVILSALSPSAEFLFFSYSLLSGLGAGLVVGMSIIILPLYFDQRRGLANTFLMAGACLGQILIPPFIRHLLDNYSYKGGALIHGAMLMNGFVAVSFFHPVEWHMKPRLRTDQPLESLAPLIPQKGSSDGPQKSMNLLDVVPQHEGTKEEPDWLAVADQARVKRTRRDTSHRESECSQESVISNILSENVSDTNSAPPDNKEGYKGNGCLDVIKTLWMILVRVAHETKSDVRILRSSRVFIISLANTLIFSSYHNFTMMVPFVMESEGHSLQDSAWGMSVMGICNLAILLILSPLSDWKRFDKRLCIMSGCVVMGSAILGKCFPS
ncbi:monocarboxylate transporter 9-like isoform X2 [Panulirus ornatus]|uniref:monocarboxylate transporter 9-like isoform X2 n=1 Tax=Panulirus ornatus TaxID=150431 RepID=UPI003A8790BA